MSKRITTAALVIALVFVFLVMGFAAPSWRLPMDHRGYEPTQPIAFSHRLHAGELKIACLYCHGAAEQGRRAGVPAASTCMNCHRLVTAPMVAVQAEDKLAQEEKRPPNRIFSPELQKLYDHLGLILNEKQELVPSADQHPEPVPWIKVHNLPDFVYFDHSSHVRVGVACQKCHDAVESMEKVRQASDLTMGWCVNCHRTANEEGVSGRRVHASTDCVTCHH